ncbi:MAG: hypothetical protein ABI776_07325 [Nocardioidaceae bacterium]
MSKPPRYSSDLEAYPRQPPAGRPRADRRGRRFALVFLWASGAVVAAAVLVGAGLVVLGGFDPMGDEWVCSDGEAPAGPAHGPGGACYAAGATLPAGVVWDPFGNRPMPYNCDKDGWVPIERTTEQRGVSNDEMDCVRTGTELPGRWHLAQEPG